MFILTEKIEAITSSDITLSLVAPVDCRIESAHIISDVAVGSGASPKLVCEIYDDADTNVLLSADSQAAGFSQNVPFAMTLQNGVSKRYESGQAIQLKADVTGTLSATAIRFVIKCVPARDI